MRQALLISIWQLSTILLLTSSSLKLFQVGWGQMHIFRFLQKYLIGFNPRLWLGHSRTFTELSINHSCCVFRVIVLLEGEASAQSEDLNALDWVFIKTISIFGCIELFFYSEFLMSPSVPAPEKHLHSTRPLPAHFTFGMVLCRWWAELVSFKHDAWNWGSSNQIILFFRVWGSFRCFFVNSKCVSICLHCGEDWFWPRRHKAQIGGVLQCLSFFRFLRFAYMIMELN